MMIATDPDAGRKLGLDLAYAFGELFDVAIPEIRTDFPVVVEHPAINRAKGSALAKRLHSQVLLQNVKRFYGSDAYTEIVDALNCDSGY